MGAASSSFKRLFVRRLYESAVANSTTILALLKVATEARITETESGLALVGTMANRQQASFQIPPDFNPTDAVDLLSEIRDRYDEAVAKLIANGTASPTDAQIQTELLATIRPNRGAFSDFSKLRYEPVDVGDES
jgi:hypothetical protein